MPRRYYRRRTVVVRPKKKWASNISIKNFTINSENPQPCVTLASNAVQSGTPTPVIVKAGNFKVNADIVFTGSSSGTYNLPLQLMAVVIYVPESITIPNNTYLGSLVQTHPEYIMAWKQFDVDMYSATNASQARQVVVSSRMKRNLNSGDSIVFGVLNTEATGTTLTNLHVAITVQYWTCAN